MAHRKRKLTVTGLDAKTSGISNKTGKEWTLYEVAALGEDGAPIDARLKTFDGSLAIGELVEYEVERQEHEKYGESFLISKPGGGLKASVDDLRARVERLESLVAQLQEERS